jgi:hypothetical protein
MRGIRPLFEAIGDMFAMLPPWAPAVFGVVIAMLGWPLFKASRARGRARRAMRSAAGERGAERERLEAEAITFVEGDANGLLIVADLALAQGRKELAARAAEKLRATGKLLHEHRRLLRQLEPPLPALPSEACIVIEQLLRTGLAGEARVRLDRARKKWPFDEELEALEGRVPAAAAQR